MRNDNIELSDILLKEYKRASDFYYTTELPDKLETEIDNDVLIVKYPSTIIEKELNNYDSFEGWINVFHKWGIFNKIRFRWEEPHDKSGNHYQNFLTRVDKFRSTFSSFFELEERYQKCVDDRDTDFMVDDRNILETIIEIDWYFETEKRIKIEIPKEFEVDFTEEGSVRFSEHVNSDDDKDIFSPWQLIIERWAYMKTVPRPGETRPKEMSGMTQIMKDLIKVGFTERSIVYPTD